MSMCVCVSVRERETKEKESKSWKVREKIDRVTLYVSMLAYIYMCMCVWEGVVHSCGGAPLYKDL